MENKEADQTTIKPIESDWFYDDIKADYHSKLVQWREISKENYWYALEVIPPLDRRNGAFLVGEPFDHAEDDVIYGGFVQIGNRYFARLIGRKQFTEAVAAIRQIL